MKKRRLSKAEQLFAAHHEAGHAVVAACEGLPITSVEIAIYAGVTHGSCYHPGILGIECEAKERLKIARSCILISYAGVPAEQIVNPSADYSLEGSADEDNVMTICRDYGLTGNRSYLFGDDGHQKYLKRYERKAAKLVRDQQKAVRALAGYLIERKRLSGNEVEKVLRPFNLFDPSI